MKNEMETLTIKLPKPLKKELRHLSIDENKTMSEIIQTLLEKYLEETQ